MTLAELIAYVDQIRPNAFDKEMETGWVSEIERKVYEQVINKAAPTDAETWEEYIAPSDAFHGPYNYEEDAERTLLVEDAHKAVYVTYLLAQMDYANMELERYNADAAMHQAAWDEYASEYRRNHMPRAHELTVPPRHLWYS